MKNDGGLVGKGKQQNQKLEMPKSKKWLVISTLTYTIIEREKKWYSTLTKAHDKKKLWEKEKLTDGSVEMDGKREDANFFSLAKRRRKMEAA